MGTSSADPFALSQYASDGLALVAALKGDSDALTAALSALRTSASPFVPYLGDADSVLADLVGDWQHLDEFAGDVANGFFAANPELSEHGMRDGIVLRMSDEAVMASGHVGYADRDTAIAEAHRLAADVAAAYERGRVSDDDMRDFAARAARGRFDPAFSVAFVTDLGVDRMAALPALIQTSAFGNETGSGWAKRLLAPVRGRAHHRHGHPGGQPGQRPHRPGQPEPRRRRPAERGLGRRVRGLLRDQAQRRAQQQQLQPAGAVLGAARRRTGGRGQRPARRHAAPQPDAVDAGDGR